MATKDRTRDRRIEHQDQGSIGNTTDQAVGQRRGNADRQEKGIDDQRTPGAGAGIGAGAEAGAEAQNKTAEAAAANDILIEPQLSTKPIRRRRRDAGLVRGPAPKPAIDVSAENAAIVQTVILTLSGVAIGFTNNTEAAINEAERSVIEPAALRMLSRASETAREKITLWGDPIMLLTGLGLWIVRLSELRINARRAAASRPTQARQATPAAPPTMPNSEAMQARADGQQPVYSPTIDLFRAVGE